MSKSKKKAKDLIEEDSDLEGVLETILEVQEEEGEVTWGDVKTEATSGQWGRLIEKGILVEADGDGFVLDDKDGAKELLGLKEVETDDEESEGSEDIEIDEDDVDASWSWLEKGAGVFILFLFIFGYRGGTTQQTIASAVGLIIEPLMSTKGGPLPTYHVILLLAIATGLYSSFIQKYLVNWDWVNKQREKATKIQEEIKSSSGDGKKSDEMNEKRQKAASIQMSTMKMQFKSTVWIMLITIPMFIWMIWEFRQGHADNVTSIVMPFMGEVKMTENVIPVIPFGQAWFAWYLITSFGLGQVVRKAVGYNLSS